MLFRSSDGTLPVYIGLPQRQIYPVRKALRTSPRERDALHRARKTLCGRESRSRGISCNRRDHHGLRDGKGPRHTQRIRGTRKRQDGPAEGIFRPAEREGSRAGGCRHDRRIGKGGHRPLRSARRDGRGRRSDRRPFVRTHRLRRSVPAVDDSGRTEVGGIDLSSLQGGKTDRQAGKPSPPI